MGSKVKLWFASKSGADRVNSQKTRKKTPAVESAKAVKASISTGVFSKSGERAMAAFSG